MTDRSLLKLWYQVLTSTFYKKGLTRAFTTLGCHVERASTRGPSHRGWTIVRILEGVQRLDRALRRLDRIGIALPSLVKGAVVLQTFATWCE